MNRASTIGYEGTNIEEFISEILKCGVTVLIDVRQLALSRKKGFSKTALSERLESVGVRYVHLRGLGDPKPGRIAAREGRHSDFTRIYREHLKTREAQADLASAIELSETSHVCLLCFEREAIGCHRKIISDTISRKTDVKFSHLVVGVASARSFAPSGRRGSADIGEGTPACQ